MIGLGRLDANVRAVGNCPSTSPGLDPSLNLGIRNSCNPIFVMKNVDSLDLLLHCRDDVTSDAARMNGSHSQSVDSATTMSTN